MTTAQTLAWLGLVFAALIIAFIAGRISGLDDRKGWHPGEPDP